MELPIPEKHIDFARLAMGNHPPYPTTCVEFSSDGHSMLGLVQGSLTLWAFEDPAEIATHTAFLLGLDETLGNDSPVRMLACFPHLVEEILS